MAGHGLASQLIACLLVSAAARLDGEECAASALDCAGAEEDSSALLQVLLAKSTWTELSSTNCYPGQGAVSSERWPEAVDGLSHCQQLYGDYDGVVMDEKKTTCWGIMGIDQSSCETNSPYDTWIKDGSSFCNRACSTLTEHTDCGGECGLCDGQYCIKGSPVGPPPSPPSFCGNACSTHTEHIDCGGECGLCDGEMCTMGSPVGPPPSPPSPQPSEWTLHEGFNCYEGNGAMESHGPEDVDGYPSCKSKFASYDGVVMTKSQLKCWGIKGITKSQCIKEGDYDTYMA